MLEERSLPGEKEPRRRTGSLGHLFSIDWWVLAGDRGTSVVWQCQALHATASLVGAIVWSAKNSNHFKPKCWCWVPPPLPHYKCSVCERALFSRKVNPPRGIGGSTKSPASVQQRHAGQMENSLTQKRKQTRLVPSSSCQTLALI